MKIAVVGAGFCGLGVAWHLLHHTNLQITIFDSKGVGHGASGIAAGLLHPFAGAHAKLNRSGREGVTATKELLEASSQALGRAVIAPSPGILRPALSPEQVSDFQFCAERYPDETEWLEPKDCQQLAPGCPPVPGLWVKEGMTVYSSLYLQGLQLACLNKGVQFKQQHIQSLTNLNAFDCIILTAGAEIAHFPESLSLPISLVKGQVLELAWPGGHLPLAHPLNSHVYIVMSADQKSCLVGSTYEKGFTEAQVDVETARKEILPKLDELYPPLKDAPILNCYAGMRVVSKHHLPLIHPLSSKQWILTAMGSKGLLYHALYAKELVNKIWEESHF